MRTPLAVAACLTATLLVPASPALAKKGSACSTTARAHFVGLGGTDSLNNVHTRNCTLGAQARAGAGVLRQGIDWAIVARRHGRFSFHSYDGWVLAAAKHHMRVLAILSNPPRSQERRGSGVIGPPKSDAAFGRYAAAAVRRFGPKGSLWRGRNRKYRKWAIHSWQVWNEPNIPQYWGGHPNARAYVKLLAAGARAIHKVDRKAEIVTAGLPESLIKHAIQAKKYIPQLYRAGAKRWFTTLAINPYAPTAKGVIAEVRKIRKIMVHHGDRGGRLWVTEVGWGTGGPASRFNIGSAGQAKQLGALLKGLYRQRKSLRLDGVVYYDWKDKPPYPPTYKDMWGLHTGLLTLGGSGKPAYTVFARTAPRLK